MQIPKMKKTSLKNSPLKIIFFGTPAFSAEILAALFQSLHSIVAVVTQPDRPQGRSGQLIPSPVKQFITQAAPHIPCLQPEKASQPEFLAKLAAFQADIYVVAAFGQILSQALLDIPPLGAINVHTSLLPKYRGAAPIQRALMAGESISGVTIMKIVRQLDAGDILAVSEIPLPQEMTFGELEAALCALSKPLLLDVLSAYQAGIPPSTPQDASKVILAPKITTEECKINWNRDAESIHNQIRALSPTPGAWCWLAGLGDQRRVKIFHSIPINENISSTVGQISLQKNGSLAVSCGIGTIQIFSIQPEGKRPMTSAEWARGYHHNFTHISFN